MTDEKKSDKKPEFQLRKTADLIPSAQNSRTHSDEQIEKLKASITQFGFLNPVIVAKDNTIIAGHGRVMAAKALGIEEVPTILADHLTDAQRRAYMIADNRLAEDAGWNEEILARELKDLFIQEFDLDVIGFEDSELERLLHSGVSRGDAEAVPDLPPVARSAKGETWLLGEHRLRCGDSTNEADIAALMNSEGPAELLFTSPPYSDIRTYGGGKDLSVDHLIQFISKFFPHAHYQAINLGLKRENHEIVQYWDAYIAEARKAGYLFLAWNVWSKTNAGSVGNQSAFIPISHEWVFVFGKKFKDINRTEERKSKPTKHVRDVRQDDGSMKPSTRGRQEKLKEMESVFHSAPELGEIRKQHPATFPIDLPTKYIEAISNEGQTIIEPFSGSGTTIIACEATHRKCRAMELDPIYCDVAITRWQNYTGKKAKRESDGILFDDLKPAAKPEAAAA